MKLVLQHVTCDGIPLQRVTPPAPPVVRMRITSPACTCESAGVALVGTAGSTVTWKGQPASCAILFANGMPPGSSRNGYAVPAGSPSVEETKTRTR